MGSETIGELIVSQVYMTVDERRRYNFATLAQELHKGSEIVRLVQETPISGHTNIGDMEE